MLKILALGNSFSCDCTTYLDRVASGLFVRNLFIGGCSLEGHVDKIQNKKAWYEYQAQGVKIGTVTVSANDIIASEDWDYITVQQASHHSGMYETFDPYLTEILDFIRKTCPKAKIVWHQTWSYSTTSDHPGFANYERNQDLMWSKIEECSYRAVEEHGIEGMIKVGEAIQALRCELTPDGTDFAATASIFLTITDVMQVHTFGQSSLERKLQTSYPRVQTLHASPTFVASLTRCK